MLTPLARIGACRGVAPLVLEERRARVSLFHGSRPGRLLAAATMVEPAACRSPTRSLLPTLSALPEAPWPPCGRIQHTNFASSHDLASARRRNGQASPSHGRATSRLARHSSAPRRQPKQARRRRNVSLSTSGIAPRPLNYGYGMLRIKVTGGITCADSIYLPRSD